MLPLKSLRGSRLDLDAQSLNLMRDAANASKNDLLSAISRSGPNGARSGCVLVQNNTGSDRAQFDVITLDTLIITPELNLSEFNDHRLFAAVTPASGDDPYVAVLQEPIADGALGYARIAGETPVNMQRAADDTSSTVGVSNGQYYLQSGGQSAQILWEDSYTGTDTHLAVVNLSRGGAGINVMQFQIVAIYDDYLDCYAYDDVSGPDDSQLIHVAKPYLLRRSPFNEQTYNGVSYAYTNAYMRTATLVSDPTKSEVEIVIPPYVVNDIIVADQGVQGFDFATLIDGDMVTLEWLEQNRDGRGWETQES